MMQPLSAPVLRPSREGAPPGAVAGALSRGAWAAVAIVMAVVWFALLDSRSLQHPDEGRYAEIGREMLVSGDWVTPRLNDLKYFEKPALQYWLTAAAFDAFGIREGAARLPVALAGLLTVVAIGFAGMKLAGPTAGAYSAVVLAGMVWPFGASHIITLDAMLTFWLALALALFLVAQRDDAAPGACRAYMLGAWAAMAGAVLTKGLVGVLIPGAALVLYSFANRDFAPWRRLHPVTGTALLLALTAPWFLAVSLRNPEFAPFFFIHEHFQRFLTTEHRRPGAWWYFVPVLVVGLLPWIGIVVAAAWRGWRDAPRGVNGFAWSRFCLVWIAFVFLFFSASGSKLPSYILPLFPAAALLAGWQLAVASRRLLLGLIVPLAAGAWIALALTVALYSGTTEGLASGEMPVILYERLAPYLYAAIGVAAAGYTIGAILLARDGDARRSWAVIAVSLATMLMLQIGLAGNDVFRTVRSGVELAAALERDRPAHDPSAPVYQVGIYDQTLPFYLERPTTLVNYRDEFALGMDAEPAKSIPKLDDWLARWSALPQGYAVVGQDTLDIMVARGVPLRIVAREPRRLLIARR